VPSIIVFAGPRTPENLYSRENANLFVKILCGPCWIQESRAEGCGYDSECLRSFPSAGGTNKRSYLEVLSPDFAK